MPAYFVENEAACLEDGAQGKRQCPEHGSMSLTFGVCGICEIIDQLGEERADYDRPPPSPGPELADFKTSFTEELSEAIRRESEEVAWSLVKWFQKGYRHDHGTARAENAKDFTKET